MCRSIAVFVAAALVLILFCRLAAAAEFPSKGDQRRSMGNLRPNAQPATPSRSGWTHRPWSYGNPPYYSRPPVTHYPYYAVPNPYGYYPYYRPGAPYYYPPVRYYWTPWGLRRY